MHGDMIGTHDGAIQPQREESELVDKVDVSVDTRGMNCPQPLIEARKSLRKMSNGQVLEVVGDHSMSREEIPMSMEDTGDKVLEVKDLEDGSWKIYIEKGE